MLTYNAKHTSSVMVRVCANSTGDIIPNQTIKLIADFPIRRNSERLDGWTSG